MYGRLNKDTLELTTLEMDLPTLGTFCRTNKLNSRFCRSLEFWKRYFQRWTGSPAPEGLSILDLIYLLQTRHQVKPFAEFVRETMAEKRIGHRFRFDADNMDPNWTDYELVSRITEIKVIMPVPPLPYMSRIRYLFLLYSRLRTIPPFPNTLRDLTIFNGVLGNVRKESLPDSIEVLTLDDCGITNIEKFPVGASSISCGGNELTTLPPLPPKLVTLGCSRNKLASLPELPSSLATLLAEQNNLTRIPKLPSRIKLANLRHNPLSPETRWYLSTFRASHRGVALA